MGVVTKIVLQASENPPLAGSGLKWHADPVKPLGEEVRVGDREAGAGAHDVGGQHVP